VALVFLFGGDEGCKGHGSVGMSKVVVLMVWIVVQVDADGCEFDGASLAVETVGTARWWRRRL
jgi:hypothetical protein